MKTFEELDLIAPVRRALVEENYQTPTPIQAQTIPAAMEGADVLGCAQTGTGKTAAFALPILHLLGQENRKAVANRPQVLILAPTRELAIQIDESFAAYGRHLKLRRALLYGGVGQGNQVRALDQGAHILVATPGRLLDLMNQGYVRLDQLTIFVLDEADRMLDMGFLPDLKRIISKLPSQRQSLFFSATLPPKIMDLAKSLLRNPVNVNVTPKSSSVERIDQQVLFVERSKKLSMLRLILGKPEVYSAIVFTKTKRGANQVAEKLARHGIEALPIHGNKSQNARQRALDAFKLNKIQVLVATDLAARGIDVDGVTHVINYDLPVEPESYVHRIGRTARAGATGIALSLCSSAEKNELRAIEQFIGRKIPAAPNQPKFDDLESEATESRTPQRGRSGPRRSQSERPATASGDGRRSGTTSRPAVTRTHAADRGADSRSSERVADSRRETPSRRPGRSEPAPARLGATDDRSRSNASRPARSSSSSSSRDAQPARNGRNAERTERSETGRRSDAPVRTSERRSGRDRQSGSRSETREVSPRSVEPRAAEHRGFRDAGTENERPPRKRHQGFQSSQQARQTN